MSHLDDFEFDPRRTALLVIDMQRDFLEPGGFGEQLGNRCELARHPGQLVVDCGQHFLFNGLDLHAVADGPSAASLQSSCRLSEKTIDEYSLVTYDPA